MKILVIGDSCTDVYIYGRCTRLAPEGPVPVFMTTRTETNGGMARNVHENLLSLNADSTLISNPEIITKTRYIEDRKNHLLMRIDSHERKVNRIVDIEKIAFDEYDGVLISDYNHGFLTEDDIRYICDSTKGVVFMDTKKILGSWCLGIDFIKINEFEYENSHHSLELCDKNIQNKLIITLGDKGCVYMGKTYPVDKVDVKDMEGAGDTFLAGFALTYLQSRDVDLALQIANNYATIIVQHKGVNRIGDFL